MSRRITDLARSALPGRTAYREWGHAALSENPKNWASNHIKSDCKHPAFRQRDILARLNEFDRELLLSRCIKQHFTKGQNLFTAGSQHKATYLIESGLIQTYHESPAGKGIALGYWSAGDLIGGPHFFNDEGIHVWSAQAVADSSVLTITGRNLKELTLSAPAIGEAVMDAVCFKCLWDSVLLQLLGTRSVASRLAHLLVKLAELHGVICSETVVINHQFSQEELANMVGATRQWVNAKFAELRRDGTLEIQHGQVVIRNLERLKKLAEW